MPIDALQAKSETSGPALRANPLNARRVRIDTDTGDIVIRESSTVKRKLTYKFSVEAILPGAQPQTAANYGIFWTAPFACQVLAAQERHETAGNDAGAVTLGIKKVPSGTAKAAGVDVMGNTFNLKGTADTNQDATLNGTAANLLLAAGDSLALILTGTPTTLAGVAVTVTLQKT